MEKGLPVEDVGEEEKSIYLVDLEEQALAAVLSFLSIQDIVRVSETCRTLRLACQDDALWRRKALEKYPESTVYLRNAELNKKEQVGETQQEEEEEEQHQHQYQYHSYLDLLKDDNAKNASLLLPVTSNLSCDYKLNRALDYFFECCITGVQYNRGTDVLRVFFDARGEPDLRQPMMSSLGVSIHREYGRKTRRELRASVVGVFHQRRELLALVDELQPGICRDQHIAARHHAARTALNAANSRLIQLVRELQDNPAYGFSDLLTVLRPSSQHLTIDTPGHFKGYLDFEKISQVDALATELPSSWRLKKELQLCGLDVIFCYANPVPTLPHHIQVDYNPATLLTVGPGFTLASAAQAMGVYAPHDQLCKEMKEESVDQERERWSLVRQEFECSDRNFESWFV